MKSVKTIRKAAGNLKLASRNLRQTAKLANASAKVIKARARLAAAGDQTEVARMVPEKVIALSWAGLAFARHATRLAAQIGTSATSELRALQSNSAAIARTRNPLEAAFVQGNALWSWWGRAAAQTVTLTERMMRAQYAVTAPIARTAKGNTRRLSRSNGAG